MTQVHKAFTLISQMADKNDRYQDNMPGMYYVDTDCIACDTCYGIAPKHFILTQNNDHAIVVMQPETHGDIQLCNDAMAACPVGAIGNDGDQI